MNILFAHNNFPGQFVHLAGCLARERGHQVVAIGGPKSRGIVGVELVRYRLRRGSSPGILPLAVRYEADCLRGSAAIEVAVRLAGAGFRPDVVIGHSGWGELLFMREIWPDAKSVAYAEYYYRGRDSDVSFDPEISNPNLASMASMARARAKNGGLVACLAEADLAIAPTRWQRSCFPETLQSRIAIVHDGIDTANARPQPEASLQLPDGGPLLRAGDEIVTYVNRKLEPMRGIHVFLRALPAILANRPSAHVLIVGSSDERPYGKPPPQGRTWKDVYLDEVRDRIDPARVHWLGRLDHPAFGAVLALSRVHVYLTYPFVLSWSLLEAMSTGCLVVASATAPVQEVIEHGRNGLLFDFFDHQALAVTVIDGLARPPQAFAAIKAAARETVVTRYDRDAVCLPRLVSLIEGLAR